VVAFLLVPDLIMRALFARGAFTTADAAAAGQTLAAYAIGLVPFVLIRSATATFLARGDTATPVKAALVAVAVNIAFKVLLMGPLAQVGLALATSIGAWINLILVLWLAVRAGFLTLDPRLGRSFVKVAGAALALAVVLWLAQAPVARLLSTWPSLRDETALALLALLGGVVYGGTVFALFGRQWLAALRPPKT
jgi:putative peptidoglycan lipid II flippase